MQTDIYSSKSVMPGPLGEDLDRHFLHPQGLGVDLQQMDSMNHELHIHPFPSPFSDLEQLNSSSSSGIPFNEDTFFLCNSPTQTNQVQSLLFKLSISTIDNNMHTQIPYANRSDLDWDYVRLG
uniref:Uncharacterized protein n=1 Tax=Nelumbo nucifera TaxID=4432 RepID=A0A822YLW6_NELNU|nr:TPA_asm: hypothetical protein HUJ06_010747 [Nelumbo nucifera]